MEDVLRGEKLQGEGLGMDPDGGRNQAEGATAGQAFLYLTYPIALLQGVKRDKHAGLPQARRYMREEIKPLKPQPVAWTP